MIIILKKLTKINFKEGKLDFLLRGREIEYEAISYKDDEEGVFLQIKKEDCEKIEKILINLKIAYFIIEISESDSIEFFNFLKDNFGTKKEDETRILRSFLYDWASLNTEHIQKLANLYIFITEKENKSKKGGVK
jgi:hypothetical protein